MSYYDADCEEDYDDGAASVKYGIPDVPNAVTELAAIRDELNKLKSTRIRPVFCNTCNAYHRKSCAPDYILLPSITEESSDDLLVVFNI